MCNTKNNIRISDFLQRSFILFILIYLPSAVNFYTYAQWSVNLNVSQNPVCSGDTIHVYAVAPNNAVLSWYIDNVSYNNNSNSFDFVPLHNIQIKVEALYFNQVKTDSIFIEVIPTPQASLITQTPTCEGCMDGSVNIYAVGAPPLDVFIGTNPDNILGQYLDAEPNTPLLFSDLPVGEYYVYIENEFGCRWDSLFNIFPQNDFELNLFSTSNQICLGESVTLAAHAGSQALPISYYWEPVGISQAVFEIFPDTTITFTCYATDDSNFTAVATKTIVVNKIAINNNVSNADCAFCPNGSIYVQIVNGVFPFLVQWTGTNFSSNSLSLTNILPGYYTIEIIDATGCTFSQTFLVPIEGEMDAGQDIIVCAGSCDTLQPFVNNPNNFVSFTWSPIIGIENPNNLFSEICPTISTTYTLTGFDGINTYIDSLRVVVDAISAIPTIIHAGCNVCNDGQIHLEMIGGAPPYSYNWSTGSQTQNLAGLTVGSYYVTITDQNNCIYSDTIQVDCNKTEFAVNCLVKDSAENEISFCNVYVIAKLTNGNSWYIVDSALTNESGVASIIVIHNPIFEYYLYAKPNVHYNEYTPTYFPTSLIIQQADIINVPSCEPINLTIQLQKKIDGNRGLGKINGHIYKRLNNNSLAPINNLRLIIRKNDAYVREHYTIENGFFEFDSLTTGLYRLWADYPNINTALAPIIELTSETPNQTNLLFILEKDKLNYYTNISPINKNEINIFPNPVHELLFIKTTIYFDTYTIISLQGDTMLTGNFERSNTNSINIAKLSQGTYILCLQNEKDSYYSKFIKSK